MIMIFAAIMIHQYESITESDHKTVIIFPNITESNNKTLLMFPVVYIIKSNNKTLLSCSVSSFYLFI